MCITHYERYSGASSSLPSSQAEQKQQPSNKIYTQKQTQTKPYTRRSYSTTYNSWLWLWLCIDVLCYAVLFCELLSQSIRHTLCVCVSCAVFLLLLLLCCSFLFIYLYNTYMVCDDTFHHGFVYARERLFVFLLLFVAAALLLSLFVGPALFSCAFATTLYFSPLSE